MDLISAWLAWLEHNKGRAPRTAVKYGHYLAKFVAFLAERDLSLSTAKREHLEAFAGLYAHQELKLKPRARKPLVAALRSFYAWAHAAGGVAENVAELLEYPKAGKRLPRAMALESAEAILMQCDLTTFIGVRDAAILSVLIGCGPRVSGVCNLNEEDLLWRNENGRERLVIRFREKGDKERLVPAPHETALMLHAYLGHPELEAIDRLLEDGNRVLFVSVRNRQVPEHEYRGEARRIAERSVFDRLRQYGEAAGVPVEQLHPHAIRHLFGTEMAEDDVNLLVHQELMGHEDPKTTKGYAALAMRKKTEAIDKASPLRKIRTPVSELARSLEKPRRGAP
jgi:site-specific recombinase XerD